MCSRVSASRDPGSVSEAESEEENEEGDYTVYECPGLASVCFFVSTLWGFVSDVRNFCTFMYYSLFQTSEMEVKNPLFHDDPTPATPATPAQINKEEDHM